MSKIGERFCMHRLICTVTRALKSSTGGLGSSPSKISRTLAFSNGHASSGERPLMPKADPRLSISAVWGIEVLEPGTPGVLLRLLAREGHSERSVLNEGRCV